MPVKRAAATACVLVLAVATPVAAQQQDARILKGAVNWQEPDRHVVRADGLGILTYSLPEDARQARGAKSLFPYIVYTSIGRPTISGGIDAFDINPLEFARYYYAMIVANLGTTTARGKFTLKLTGPTRWTRTFPNTSVSGRTFTVLYYREEPLNRVGNYLLKGTFKGAGSTKSRFCAGC